MEESPITSNKSEIDETSLNSQHKRIGGGFWNEWKTVENEKMEKVTDDKAEKKGHRASSFSAKTDISTHLSPNEQHNDAQNNHQQQMASSSPQNREFNDEAEALPAECSDDYQADDLGQVASSSPPSALSSSNSISSLPKSSSSSIPPESNDQMPSSNFDSSISSVEVSVLTLSQNKHKNLRFFIDVAIAQSKLATPIALEDKLKVLDWLGNSAQGEERFSLESEFPLIILRRDFNGPKAIPPIAQQLAVSERVIYQTAAELFPPLLSFASSLIALPLSSLITFLSPHPSSLITFLSPHPSSLITFLSPHPSSLITFLSPHPSSLITFLSPHPSSLITFLSPPLSSLITFLSPLSSLITFLSPPLSSLITFLSPHPSSLITPPLGHPIPSVAVRHLHKSPRPSPLCCFLFAPFIHPPLHQFSLAIPSHFAHLSQICPGIYWPTKIRRKSDPAFVRRNAHQFANASPPILTNAKGNESTAAQIIRKWSTKSNSNGTELIRTLREQFGGRSAGNIASRGNSGRSTSSPSSRPHLAFLVQQSDSAIGSSLCGSCSFLPPPPPYRPLRCSSGSEGAIPSMDNSVHAQYQQPLTVQTIGNANGDLGRAKDFTSLLGFDCILPMMRDCEKNGSDREVEEEGAKRENEKKNGGGTNKQILSVRKNDGGRTVLKVAADGEGKWHSKRTEERGPTAAGEEQPQTVPTTTGCVAQTTAASPSPSPSMSASCSDFPDSQERLQRLQMTRESLSLQVAALSRQVALQREKIRDLEESLGRGTNGKQYIHGATTAGQCQQQKEIGEQLAELRHNFLTLEKEKMEAERNWQINEVERLTEHEHSAEQKDTKIDELERLQMAVQKLMADNEQKNSLIKTLHNALEEQQRRMLSANLLHQQNDVSAHQLDINEQIRRILLTQDDLSLDGSDNSMAHSSSFPVGLCAQSFRSASPRRTPQPFPPSGSNAARQQCFPVSTSFSSSLSQLQTTAMVPPPPLWRVCSPTPPSIPPHRLVIDNNSHTQAQQLEQPSTSTSRRTPTSPLARQLAAELDELRQSGVGGVLLRQPYSTASLPRSIHSKANSFGACLSTQLRHGECFYSAEEDDKRKRGGETGDNGTQREEGIAKGNGTTPFWSDWVRRVFGSTSKASQKQRAHSTPNLAHSRKVSGEETVESDDDLLLAASSARGSVPNCETNGHSSANAKHLKRGRRARSTLRSFLGRFAHRGNSLQDVRPSQRLSPSLLPSSSSSCLSIRPPLDHFVDWDRAHCSRWLTEIGFGDAFVGAVRSGRHLLSLAETNFETELGIRSALQRKRLKCMLDRIERNTETEAADKMDTNSVMLWLDQIGLPQLRDSFAENRIDGHLLLVLSVNDLIELGVHSALNHASLARAIQFLRSVDFHLHRLEKHFSSELLSRCPIPAEVERWSHCCTVEWLRNEDLEEFTPNLAFSGLHGALMVFEPIFTAESLAEMLQIPPTKSLIRRHLTTQFNALLGQQIVGNKRDTVAQPMATHLTPGLKIRLAKRGFSLGRKKSKSDIFVEPEVRICPDERMAMNGTERGEMSEV